MQRLIRTIAPAVVAAAAGACGGGNTAQQIIKSPEYAPDGQTKCHAAALSTSPLIVEWPSAARGDLEAIVEEHKTVAVVHYVGCTMTVLSDCTAPGKVSYLPYRNGKQDQLRITSADDLYANLPVGAATLEGKLERAGELDVDMMLVGQYEAAIGTVTRADLKGTCDGATHVVERVTVGAFDFHTAANANVGGGVKVMGAGGGASSAATRDDIARDGKVDACSNARASDTDPPENCGALVRLQLVPLGVAPALTAKCPEGTTWNGVTCAPDSLQTDASLSPEPARRPTRRRRTPTGDESTWNVHFTAQGDDSSWVLIDGASTVCTLPCDQTVSSGSVYQLRHTNHQSDIVSLRGSDLVGNPTTTPLTVEAHGAGGFGLGFQLTLWSFFVALGSGIGYGLGCGGSSCSALPTAAGIGGISLGGLGMAFGIWTLAHSHFLPGFDVDTASRTSGITITGAGPGGFSGTF